MAAPAAAPPCPARGRRSGVLGGSAYVSSHEYGTICMYRTSRVCGTASTPPGVEAGALFATALRR